MYVYLLQGAEAAEDVWRQRRQLVVLKNQFPVGRREDRGQAYTGRHRIAFACASVCVRVCQLLCVHVEKSKRMV